MYATERGLVVGLVAYVIKKTKYADRFIGLKTRWSKNVTAVT